MGTSYGNAIVNPSGTISYSAYARSTAITDTLSYKVADTNGLFSNIASVSISVTAGTVINNNPVANNDTASVQTGEAVNIGVLANDSDSDGSLNNSSLVIINQPNSGSVVINSSGILTYTHNGSASTSDNFTYRIADNQGAESNIATVSVNITALVTICGKGLELDGVNDWINIPNLTFANDFTLEAWVKLAPGIDNKDALFGQEGGGPDVNFFAGKVRLYAYGDRVKANTAFLPDTWGHIAITRNAGNLKIYINGIEDATGRWTGILSLKAIGRGNRGYLKGMVDEVRIWNIARTETEISASFNTTIATNSAGLIGYWNFNGAGQAVADGSVSENHGSLGSTLGIGIDDPVRKSSTAEFIESCN